jgi:hypothetical protein
LKSEWVSPALDESTDASGTSQLLLFIRGVDKGSDVTEKLASVYSMHGTSTGGDMFKDVEKLFISYNLQWNPLKYVTTDGGGREVWFKSRRKKDKHIKRVKVRVPQNVWLCTASFMNKLWMYTA